MIYKHISQKISSFHGKACPEKGILVGYGALLERFKLKIPFPATLSLISTKNRKYRTPQWQVFTSRHEPEDTLYGHLIFALKYEGIDLLFFKKLFETIPVKEVTSLVVIAPLGQYSRKIWFLYEWLTLSKLPIPDLDKANYIPIVNEAIQYGLSNGQKVQRQRIINNLPGNINFCPLVYKTKKIENYVREDLQLQSSTLLKRTHKDILLRTSAFLLLKDSKASFSIEGETPTTNRAVRWSQAISQAGKKELNKEEIERLQHILIENSKFIKYGYRKQQGFIGEHDRDTMVPLPDHISANWEDLDTLMNGLFDTIKLLEVDHFHPILTAAIISFGFVIIHPLVDGNGRLHRYLIHHILSKSRFSPQGIIFPVSASILNHIDEYRKVLEAFSHPVMSQIQWEATPDHNIRLLQDTLDYYRYFDATLQVDFLFDSVQDTLQNIIPTEVNYLQQYDEMKGYLDDKYQMPDRLVALLLGFLRQNEGKLSNRARQGEFKNLTEDEVWDIEKVYGEIFG